jgi:guanylate kinase
MLNSSLNPQPDSGGDSALGKPLPGRLIVITGPSGVGKGTLLKSLRHRHPELFFSISVTTRSPRPGEVDGQDYYFVRESDFAQMQKLGNLLEWAEFAGNFYGTPRQPILEHIHQGQSVILEIELEGARQVRKSYPQGLQIFIRPPSLAELEQRIRNRGQDSELAIARRLAQAEVELQAASEFDLQIINDDLEQALTELEAALYGPSSATAIATA